MTTPILRDVTLRDGLQLTGGMLPVKRKAEIVRALFAAGMPALEIGSLARADLVPSLANSLELVAELTADELDRSWLWVATPGHVAKAAAAGVRHVQYCLSVSDAHNRANLGRDTATSMNLLPEALDIADAAGMTLQLCLATSFTCPFEGPIDPQRVLDLVEDARGSRASDVVICDTLGQARPGEVSALVAGTADRADGRGVAFHGHDTWGMGVANALAATAAGATMIDGCLGGLGGCPFAPGASGNTATEDLAFALDPEWLTRDRFADLVRLGESVTRELHESHRSQAAQGARSEARAFPWVIAD
jgi:hydroxymethylglutaryl-CoA lyase